MKSEIYLLDSNSLIGPSRSYYAFSFTQKFWQEIRKHIEAGNIVLLDRVEKEIADSKDELASWLLEFSKKYVVSTEQADIVQQYSAVLEHIKSCGFYKDTAYRAWADIKCADPWIIATAKAKNFTIVSFEQPNGNLRKSNLCKFAKIPEIATHFSVPYKNLFNLMKNLNVKL